jgi:hypothetical protein
MRTTILVLIAGALACTKPNPNRCCVDAADCQANNIPVGSTCADGLLCRGNQCVAETCSTAAECDPSAPYCVMGSCGATCSDDTQCPGAGENASDVYCVSGACVACRVGMNDCPSATPVCDMNACRTCVKDSECVSNVCDVDTGMCVSESVVRYASPTGADTNDCSLATPCTPVRAVAISDAAHPWVRVLPGTYTKNDFTISAKSFTLVGTDASLPSALTITAQSNVTFRGLSDSSYSCGGTTNGSNITIRDASSPDGNLGAANCTMSVLNSSFGSSTSTLPMVASFNDNAVVTIDRSSFTGPINTVHSDPAGLTVTATNSLFINTSFSPGVTATANAAANHIYVAYSTFYSSSGFPAAGCANASSLPMAVVFVDDIFYTYCMGWPCDAFQSTTGCAPDTSVLYPEGTRSPGTNAIVMDPKFVDGPNSNFHLQAGSPAIDVAKVIASQPSTDYDGTTRPQGAGYDIGAFEYK